MKRHSRPALLRAHINLDVEALRACDQIAAILAATGQTVTRSSVLRWCVIREAHRLMGAAAPTPNDPAIVPLP